MIRREMAGETKKKKAKKASAGRNVNYQELPCTSAVDSGVSMDRIIAGVARYGDNALERERQQKE